MVALHQEGGQACVQVFFIRAHQNWGNRAYFPRTGGAEPGEILEAFLGQFYDNKTPPRHDPGQPRSGQRRPPGRGADAASSGARWRSRGRSAARRRGWSSRRRATRARRWRGGWRRARARRRCSRRWPRPSGWTGRRSGSRSTTTATSWGRTRSAAMIVAGPEGFVKSQYRKFNIRGTELAPGDDFGMMREVLTRRFARLAQGGSGPAVGRLAGSGADRRRRRAGGGGLRGARRSSGSTRWR